MFRLVSDYATAGDQQQAIDKLVDQIQSGQERCVLLGVTGSGKTFAMANIIQILQMPTLILSHNKTLARQLWQEMSELFPENAVEYFVSYYDYYQPEAYLPNRDLYIDKELQMNERIEQERFSTVASLVSRPDVIAVGTVSTIYGLNPPEVFQDRHLQLHVGQKIEPREAVTELVALQYRRVSGDLSRGDIRLRGEVLDIWMPSRDDPIRVRFGWDGVERLQVCEAVSWEPLDDIEEAWIHPREFYMTDEDRFATALENIEEELEERASWFESKGRDLEAHRIEQRTKFDLEMLRELGSCKGVENYSRHFDGRGVGDRPYCLLDFFSTNAESFQGDKNRYLVIMDESHVTLPQVGGMYSGDLARKKNLVEHGFRLPCAYDNRPLRIDEFQDLIPQMLYVSATPGEREFRHLAEVTGQEVPRQLLHVPSRGGAGTKDTEKREGSGSIETVVNSIDGIAQMEIRPTGLLDPNIEVRSTEGQVQDLLSEINQRIERDERVLVTVLTIKFAEEVSEYLQGVGIKAHYLHSEIDTLERSEIIKALRLGHIDVIVGINLLREGLDIPEVSLVAIFDAAAQGFLRNERSLLQTIGRAARNSEGNVILYADTISPAMEGAIRQTLERRKRQQEHNERHGITPETIRKSLPTLGEESSDLLAGVAGKGIRGGRRLVAKKQGKKDINTFVKKFDLGTGSWSSSDSVLELISQPEYDMLDPMEESPESEMDQNDRVISRLEKEMKAAASRLDFERAALIRDRITELREATN
ncbi:MAG: helicase-related protein [Candidatus Thermoplasmatota archaeon]|nr:helicase-related protein [Candidatus Thermoplasmatota archaeon]MEC9137905.1 helicase-related protein [Candidatus Thermoplasmatota archaeon]